MYITVGLRSYVGSSQVTVFHCNVRCVLGIALILHLQFDVAKVNFINTATVCLIASLCLFVTTDLLQYLVD